MSMPVAADMIDVTAGGISSVGIEWRNPESGLCDRHFVLRHNYNP
jgi:hypothetical protein